MATQERRVRALELSPLGAHVLWASTLWEPSGYADEARSFITALTARGTRLAASNLKPEVPGFRERVPAEERRVLAAVEANRGAKPLVAVTHGLPGDFQRGPIPDFFIGRGMFETDSLPPAWVDACNTQDEIWVPTTFNQDSFAHAGVRVPLIKVPGGVDCQRFRPDVPARLIERTRKVRFLSVFKWEHRKGWDLLLRAWARAFHPDDDVCLILRTAPSHRPAGGAGAWVEQKIRDFVSKEIGQDVAPIILLDEDLPEEDLPGLFTACDVYVAPSRGEGWGRPQICAMAAGRAVVATRWGGHLEYMSDHTTSLVEVERLVDAGPEFPGQRWAEPSVEDLASKMCKLAFDAKLRGELGHRAREHVEKNFSWDHAAELAEARLLLALDGLVRPRPVGTPKTPNAIAVRWEGSLFRYHSLSHVNRAICTELAEKPGLSLELVPYEANEFAPSSRGPYAALLPLVLRPLSKPAQVHVRHQWPPCFDSPPEGAWVMIQPWEYGGIPAAWVKPMRDEVDEIWVPSEHVRRGYVASGIPEDKVVVVPNGVDLELYRPEGPHWPLKTQKKFRFLYVGGLVPRKGWDSAVNAYLRTFTAADDVCLVIKGYGAQGVYADGGHRQLEQLLAELSLRGGGPEIEYHPEHLGAEEVAALYRSCNVLLAPYRGEGFGMPIAEAMASGKTAIVPSYGPCLEFCQDDTALFVPSRQVPIDLRGGDLASTAPTHWGEIDLEALGKCMRSAYQQPELVADRGRRAAEVIRARYPWSGVASQIEARITELATRTPKRLSPAAAPRNPLTTLPLATLPSATLPGAAAHDTTYLYAPDWRRHPWKDVLRSFAMAYTQNDPVTLLAVLDPHQGIAATQLIETWNALCAELHRTPQAAARVVLLDGPIDDAIISSLANLASAVVAVGDERQRLRAEKLGRPVITELPAHGGRWSAGHAAGRQSAFQQAAAR